MASRVPKIRVYEFGSFRIDAENRILLQNGEIVPLQPKTFDLLLFLVENRGRILGKDELMTRVWSETVVEESNLTQHIYILRKILSLDADGQRYIETVPKHGYRFAAVVSQSAQGGLQNSLESAEGRVLSFPHSSSLEAAAAPAGDVERPQPDKSLSPRLPGARRISNRQVLIAIGLAIVLMAAAYAMLNQPRSQKSIETLAVLPFKPLNINDDDQALGLGLADDLVVRFSQTRQLIVRPTSMVLRYLREDQDPIATGRALAVDAVLIGTLRKSDGKIRVNAQLIRVKDGRSLWADTFDVEFKNIFIAQDRISEQVSEAMALQLSREGKGLLTKRYTNDSEAFELYTKAYFNWKKATRQGFTDCIAYLQQALRKDPNYALAYAGLAGAYSGQSIFGFATPKEAMPQAETMARKAIELDNSLATAHGSLAIVRMFYDWDLSGAEQAFQQAITLDPNFSEAHQYYALCLAVSKRFDESNQQLQLASQLDANSPGIAASAAWVSHLALQHDRAIAQCQKAIGQYPNFHMLYHHMGHAYAAKKMFDPAIAAYQKALVLSGKAPAAVARLAYAYAAAGRKQEAKELLAELQQSGAQPQYIAWVYIGLNDSKHGLEELKKAFEARSPDVIYFKSDPIYQPMLQNPGFTELLQLIDSRK
jgi:DNA-binding winged helix-turn-helix (wHTH) protein/TolB-like protein/Flp pilus assembly protein TadD